MDIESFLSFLEDLLLDGQKSRATDLLIEFLLQTYGKPTSLSLPDSQFLAHKSPAEIVTILRASLCSSSPKQSKLNLDVDWHISFDDFLLIEETAKFIDRKTSAYHIDEELIQSSIPSSEKKITNEESWSCPDNDEIMARADDDLFFVTSLAGKHEAWHDIGLAEKISQRLNEQPSQEESSLEGFESEDCHSDDEFDRDFESNYEILEIEDHSPDLDKYFGSGSEVELSDFMLDDLDESEPFEESDRLLDELPDEDRISISDRALQVAIAVGLKFDLRRVDIDFLQQIFIEHGWGNARIAIISLLAKGVTFRDIRLAKQMKDIWSDRRDFWIGFYQTRRDTSDYTYESSRILSWAFAVKLMKIFPEEVEFDEIEYYIEEFYDLWWSRKRRCYLKFIDYLKDIAEKTAIGEFVTEIIREHSTDYEDYQDHEMNNYGSPLYNKLNHIGLIPEIWVNGFDQRQSQPVPAVMNDYLGARSKSGKGSQNG